MEIPQIYTDSLPVYAVAEKVNASLSGNSRLVVTAPPGSGKSTLLPLTILNGLPAGKIIMLEPRRAAARQIATRMASMLGETPGQTVGYRMRFESKTSAATRIEVVTEGVMERLLVDDSTLEGVAAVIFDEFHERSLAADLSLALTLEAQEVVRPDLRIIIMSATMDTESLCAKLAAPLIKADGKMFDVRIVHGEDTGMRECVPAVVSAVRKAYLRHEGDILAFLPGVREINECVEALSPVLPEAVILPLHGMLPTSGQNRAIEPLSGSRRKIVLATPIAETSLTIAGVATVVDSGLYRAVKYDSSTGLGRLETERISLDMAAQRAGRAGRLSAGICYRLWSKAAEHRMLPARKPEITDADLCAMVLAAAVWGESDPMRLPWLTPPPAAHVAEAQRLLKILGATDDSGRVTARGRRLAEMPCHPRIASMLESAETSRMKALAADIAAVIEEKDPVNNEHDADINTRIEELRRQRTRTGASPAWRRIARIAEQYRRLTRCEEDNSPADACETGELLALAYPERIAMKLREGVYRLPGGENVRLDEADDLSGCDFLSVAAMGRRIFLASPVSRTSLEKIAVHHRNISWSSREGRLVARDELRIGVLVISSKAIDDLSPEERTEVIAEAAVKEGQSMLDFNDKVISLQQRVATVASWHPELGIPDVSTDALLSAAPEWLPLYIGKAANVHDLRKLDLCSIIRGIAGYALMEEIDRLAPARIRLPRGREIRVDYRPGSAAPVVSARIQDCFGMLDTPRLDNGTRPVLMELLSPGFKPVQLTQDLRGFWTGTYFDVRKELKRRYPKHAWPDNPLDTAENGNSPKHKQQHS